MKLKVRDRSNADENTDTVRLKRQQFTTHIGELYCEPERSKFDSMVLQDAHNLENGDV